MKHKTRCFKKIKKAEQKLYETNNLQVRYTQKPVNVCLD